MTDTFKGFRAQLAAAAAASALLTAGCATTPSASQGNRLNLGNNAAGDPCEASENWSDASLGDGFVKEQRSYSVGCRGRLATGTQARVRIFDSAAQRDALTPDLSCGSSSSITLAGFSDASARRCFDPALGFETVVIDTSKNGQFYQLSSAVNAVGPGVQAVRLFAGLDTGGEVTSDREVSGLSQLAAAPSGAVSAVAAADLDLEETLGVAQRQLFLGNYANASSLLKSALVSVDETTPPSIEAALLLEAGLADSNIRFFGSANERFEQAEELLRSPNIQQAQILGRKFAIYRGLHALNQRKFAETKDRLTPLLEGQVSGEQPLQDLVGISVLNSGLDAGDVRNSLNLPSVEEGSELVLTAQAFWALSVAAISENDFGLAQNSLGRARQALASISPSLNRTGVLWLEARLDRQLGRILAAQGDYTNALAAFAEADRKMTQRALSGVGTGTEPAIAELSLERASVVERSGASQADIDLAYQEAVAALVNARGQQTAFATARLEPYLDRMLEKNAAGDQSVLPAFFQALQVTGESGAAQQISQLQTQASSSPEIGALIRAHGDAQRKLKEVEFQIRSASSSDDELTRKLTKFQQDFNELDAKLQSEGKINRLSDRPADLKEIQASLAPGEVYVKLTIIGDAIYGLLIEKDGATPYRANGTASYTQSLVGDIRRSIDGSLSTGKRENYNVFLASLVYDILFRKIDAKLDGRSSLVIDSGPVLKAITPAVLVTDPNAQAQIGADGVSEDYSQVPFMIQKAPISIASSPSSFIASRRLGASSAKQPLIGFADPRPLADAASASGNTSIGPCALKPVDLVNLSARYAPIPRREVDLAAQALGVSNFDVISGDDFTDQKLLEMGRPNGALGDYKILHFATHGASEGQFGCEESPSALLTSFGEGASDMLLSFDEIPNLNLDANLVVLSACETESVLGEESLQLAGGVQPGETLAGLVKAFFSANARAVMATYWEASAEEDSEIFFRTFYSSGRTKSIASSLQDAQVELIQTTEYSHPFFWGPFFVVGNTANGMLAEGSVTRAEDATGEQRRVAALSN